MTVCVQIKLFLGTYLLLTKVYLCHSKSIFEEYTKAIACIATSLPFKTAHTKVLNIPSHLPPFGGQSGTLHFVRTVVQSGKAVKWYCNALLRSTLKTCLRKPSLLWITGSRGLDLQETQKSHLLQESQCDLIYLTSLWWLDTSPSKLQMVDKITVLFQWYQINVSNLSKHWILAPQKWWYRG